MFSMDGKVLDEDLKTKNRGPGRLNQASTRGLGNPQNPQGKMLRMAVQASRLSTGKAAPGVFLGHIGQRLA